AETIGPRPGQDPLNFYMHVITEKTGSLIATSGRFGALFAGAPGEVADRIAAACEQIGVAWQLSDDVIDIASNSAQSGKTPGTDLRQGGRAAALAARRGGPDRRGPAQRGAHAAARSPRDEGVPRRRAALGARGQDRDQCAARHAGPGRLPGAVRLRGE